MIQRTSSIGDKAVRTSSSGDNHPLKTGSSCAECMAMSYSSQRKCSTRPAHLSYQQLLEGPQARRGIREQDSPSVRCRRKTVQSGRVEPLQSLARRARRQETRHGVRQRRGMASQGSRARVSAHPSPLRRRAFCCTCDTHLDTWSSCDGRRPPQPRSLGLGDASRRLSLAPGSRHSLCGTAPADHAVRSPQPAATG